jgi:5-methylcytosine-specific restriction endonuclease McrA
VWARVQARDGGWDEDYQGIDATSDGRYLMICAYCGRETKKGGTKRPNFSHPTRDHVIPKSRGGRGDHNIVLACMECNCDKGDMTVDEYRVILALRGNEFSPEFLAALMSEAKRVHPFHGDLQFEQIRRQMAWEDAQGEPDWKRAIIVEK